MVTVFSRMAAVVAGLLTLTMVGLQGVSAEPLRLYVSPDGNDDRPGVGWSPDKPYRSLRRAALAVRRLMGDGRGRVGIVVTLQPGVYPLREAVVFETSHSGTASGPVVFRAEQKGAVQVSGEVAPGPWTEWRDGIYTAPFPEGIARIRTVYGPAGRLPAARTPNLDPNRPRSGGMLYALDTVEESPRQALVYDHDRLDVSRWGDAADARVVIWPDRNWNCDRVPITDIEPDRHILRFEPVRYGIRRGNRFFVEHVLGELDAPGEWYADTGTRTLYLKPPRGVAIDAARITVPATDSLVVLAGDTDKPVSHLIFEGIRFAGCSGSAIVLSEAHHLSIVACEITRTGDAGIVLRDFSSDNRIEGCDVAWTGTEGIRLEGRPDMSRKRTRAMARNLLENNHIHHVGMSRNAGGALDLRPYCGGNLTHDNVFRRNLLHDTPRKGIMMGGVNNIAEGNHIHHTNLEQSDTGAIGFCTRDVRERGCIVRHNLVHHPGGYNMLEPGKWAFPSYCWAVYLDDWTSGTVVYGNILLDAPRGGVHIHGGGDNTIENNIIRGGTGWQLEINPMKPDKDNPRNRPMRGNRILRNVVLGSSDSAWLKGNGPWREGLAECDRNLLWFQGQKPVCRTSRADRIPWPQWQQQGFDQHSSVQKPTFRPGNPWQLDAQADPVRNLGIESIPVERIGLYNSPNRFSWPVRRNWPREEPVLTADVPLPPSLKQTARLTERSAAIRIDGTPEPQEWHDATMLVLERNHRDEPAQPRSLGYAAGDEKGLYIAFDNVVNPTQPLNRGTEWGADDAVEVALRPPHRAPDGPILVLRGFVDGTLVGATDGGMERAAAVEAARRCTYAATVASPLRWTAEIFIPWTAIDPDRSRLDALQFNLTCRKTADNLFLCWKPTGRHSYGVGSEGMLLIGPAAR